MALTDDHGADVVRRPRSAASGTETIWTCVAREGRYVAVGFNDDPESGLTGRPLRKVSMGNFSVLGVMLGYNDMPVEFRRFGINPFPPEVGREVHAALLELVAAGQIRPVIGRRDHAWTRSRPRSTTTTSAARAAAPSSTCRQPMTAVRDPEALRSTRPTRRQTGLDDFGPDDFREGLDASVRRRIDGEAQLNELGAVAVPGTVVGRLVEPAAGRRLDRTGTRRCRTSASTRRSS